MADGVVVAVRVKPGSRRAAIGGSWGDPPALVIAVREPAVDGRATEAAGKALAKELGVTARDVALVSGGRSRGKLFRVDGDPARLRRKLDRLLSLGSDTPGPHDHQ